MIDLPDYQGLQISDNWFLSKDGDDAARALFDRHYSRIRRADGRESKLFVGPGEKMVLVRPRLGFLSDYGNDYDALFVWRSFVSGDGQESTAGWGVNCSIFRNESPIRASDLILEAEEVLRLAWGWHNRAYTYVNPAAIGSRNPGYCFKRAGWSRCGTTGKGLHILEKTFF